jgi:hypothetical protein
LTTSFILLVTLLFLGYLFLRAYLVDVNNSNVVTELTQELKILSNTVEKNSINLNNIEDLIIKYENSFDEFTSIISDLKKNEPNEEVLKQIKNLIKENDLLRDDIINLSKKINSSNNLNQKLVKNINNNYPPHSLIDTITLKLNSGISVNDEVQLLQNFDYSEEKISYLEKLLILSNKNFIGLKKLNKDFDKNSSEYLNDYYLSNNKNSFVKYLSNVVIIQPNFNGEIEDETVRLLAAARIKLYEKDLKSALENLLLISDNEIYFGQWVNQVNYYIEFEKTLNELFK